MSNVVVDVKDIVKNIGKNIDFMQPVYEALVNSLEAKANKIEIVFFRDVQKSIDGECPKLGSFTIKDNGEGIPKDVLEKIREPFFTTKMNGTGLGVSLSSEIIEEHGGELLYESDMGAYTLVTIILPILEWY